MEFFTSSRAIVENCQNAIHVNLSQIGSVVSAYPTVVMIRALTSSMKVYMAMPWIWCKNTMDQNCYQYRTLYTPEQAL